MQTEISHQAFVRPYRERRSDGAAWKSELNKVEKQIAGIVEAITDGMYHPSMKQKMTELETRKAELSTLLAGVSDGVPDILPSASAIYAKKIMALTKALNWTGERQEAAQTLRTLIETIVLTPCPDGARCSRRCTAGSARSWTGRSGKSLGRLQKATLPERSSRECRSHWLRGLATTDTDTRCG